MSPSHTIGMYVPGNSAIHEADPRTKLLCALCISLMLFMSQSWVVIGGFMLLAIMSVAYARIPRAAVVGTIKPIIFISIFTLLANALTFDAHLATIFLGPVGISVAGFLRGLFFVMRLITVIVATSIVTLTTSPVALTDGFTSLLRPLKAVRVPIEDVAMMLSIALRFIPTIADEASAIVEAQTARGAQFGTGSFFARARSWVPVLVPLLVALFRRADNLALAMESRCYTGVGRTRLRELEYGTGDKVALVVVVCATVAAIVLKGLGLWV